jgi:hypothetical protein
VAQAVAQLGVSRVGVYTNKNNWATVMNNVVAFPYLPVWVSQAEEQNSTVATATVPFAIMQDALFHPLRTQSSLLSALISLLFACPRSVLSPVRSLRQQSFLL